MIRSNQLFLRVLIISATVSAITASAGTGTLSLDQALEIGATSRLELTAVEAELSAARERARQQGAWLNPNIYFMVEGAPTAGDAWNGSNRVIGLEQTLSLGGRRGADHDAARLMALGVEADRDLTGRRVAWSIRTAFARVLHTRSVVEMRQKVVEATLRALRIVELRHELGEAAMDEVTVAQLEFDVAIIEVTKAETDLSVARTDLASTLGSGLDDLPLVTGVLGAPADVPDLEILLAGIDSSPILRGANARAQSRSAVVRSASRHRIPDFGVSLGLRRFGDGGGDAIDAGIRVQLPLFDRGGARLSAARADALVEDAVARLARTEQERRVREVHARLAVAEAVVRTHTEKLLPAADAVLAAAERRHAEGDAELIELLQFRASWIQRQLADLDARLELDLVRADLKVLH